MSLCAGGTLSWTVPRTAPDDALQLGGLAAAQKAQLRTQLGRDIAATKPVPADSYYGGKALYRMANLLQLARGLDDRAAAARVSTMLDRALLRWTAPGGCTSGRTQCFVYDPHARGVVGLTPSFGSELFNDHYFHYGYFLYAAAVAVGGSGSGSGAGSGASGSGASGSGADVGSAGATALRARLAPVVNLLAADIASPTPSTVLPVRRVFDAYAGHAWASGYAPFADGNNQESTSEAVGAWNGLALWAAATGNGTLRDEAEWMLSAESQNARLYGLGFDTAQPVYRGFAHSIVSLSWGGKRDYGTWFSADPSAKLGIQLIPMSPVSRYLVAGAGAGAGAGAASPSGAGDASVSAAARARVVRNIAGVPSRFRGPLGDYILMYSALGRAASASSLAEAARALPGATIDDADSRSYLLAYVLTAGR
nr:glycosyl hydrolase [Galbitalea soli]